MTRYVPVLVRWMRTSACLLFAAGLAPLGAPAQERAPKAKGIDSDDYAWNEGAYEIVDVLKLVGNVQRGKRVYQACVNCHLSTGQGREDGGFPQIAGQHSTVLTKQLIDIRNGRRDLPEVYPVVATLTDPQDLADLALYVSLLAFGENYAYGAGTDLETGERIYKRDCVACHGPRGEGNATAFYPIVAGQNYEYLLRQLRDVDMGRRRNSHPAMASIVSKLDDDELMAVADYLSRMTWPRQDRPRRSPDG